MNILENVSLKEFTTLKIGGEARYFVSIASADELRLALVFASEKRMPFVVLGGGSNVLVSDRGFPGLVVKNEIKGIDWTYDSLTIVNDDSQTVVSGAGESWDGLVAAAVLRGLWGIENLSGIPGAVGAAPVQNIGAYGAELSDVLECVEAMDGYTGDIRRFSKNECRFGYRDSIFKKPEGKQFIITHVALRLLRSGEPNLSYKDLRDRFKIYDLGFKKEEQPPKAAPFGKGDTTPPRLKSETPFGKGELRPSLLEIRNAILEIRSKKFPDLRKCGTAGSFFKNPIIPREQFETLKKKFPDLPGFEIEHPLSFSPLEKWERHRRVKVPLAWILDNICGLKGFTKGDVALFERQPIVLVNEGAATGEEVKKFAEDIARKVKEKTDIEIESEVIHIF